MLFEYKWNVSHSFIVLRCHHAAGGLAQSANDEVTPQVQELYARPKLPSSVEMTPRLPSRNTATCSSWRRILLPPTTISACLYFNQHDYAHAAKVLEQGLKLNPDMPTASAMLGLSYIEMGENEKAEPLLEAALRANPNDDDVQMALAQDASIQPGQV